MGEPPKTYVSSAVQVTPPEGTPPFELRYTLTAQERTSAVHALISQGRKLGNFHRGMFSKVRPAVCNVTIPALKYDRSAEPALPEPTENRLSLTSQPAKRAQTSQPKKRRVINPDLPCKVTAKPPKTIVFHSVEQFTGKKTPVKEPMTLQRRKPLYADSARKYYAVRRRLQNRRLSEQLPEPTEKILTLQQKLEMKLPPKYRTAEEHQLWAFNPLGFDNIVLLNDYT